MGLALVMEAINGVMDGAVESPGIREDAGGELMLLEVSPALFDVVQFGRILRQPFEGDPSALGECACLPHYG
jgi:hypothetical protein